MSVEQFVGGSKLFSWDLMPDNSNGVAYISPRHLGTVKASLRFAKPLPATTTLIAYAQYDNLVVVDAYHTVTFDYNVWCFGWQLLEAQKRKWLVARALVGVYTTGTCLHVSWLPSWSTRLLAGLLGNTDMVFSSRLSACRVFHFLWHRTTGVYLLMVAEHGLPGHMAQYKNATGTILEVLRTLHLLLPGHEQPGCALGHHYRFIPGIRLCLQWGPDQTPSKMTYTCIYTATTTANCY